MTAAPIPPREATRRVSDEQVAKVLTWAADMMPSDFGREMARDLQDDRSALNEAREIVAKVNGCFGSHGYYTNPHPAEIVEDLKECVREYWLKSTKAETDLRDSRALVADLTRRLAEAERREREAWCAGRDAAAVVADGREQLNVQCTSDPMFGVDPHWHEQRAVEAKAIANRIRALNSPKPEGDRG